MNDDTPQAPAPDVLSVPIEVTQLQHGDVLIEFEVGSVTIVQGGRRVVVHLEHEDETGIFLASNVDTDANVDASGTMLFLTHDRVMHECPMHGEIHTDCVGARAHLLVYHGINYTPSW